MRISRLKPTPRKRQRVARWVHRIPYLSDRGSRVQVESDLSPWNPTPHLMAYVGLTQTVLAAVGPVSAPVSALIYSGCVCAAMISAKLIQKSRNEHASEIFRGALDLAGFGLAVLGTRMASFDGVA